MAVNHMVIRFNVSHDPQLYIARIQPEQMMQLVQIYQKKLKRTFTPKISSIMALCGNVTIKALQSQDMTISFGCQDSRDLGKLTRDMLFVGIPKVVATQMCN